MNTILFKMKEDTDYYLKYLKKHPNINQKYKDIVTMHIYNNEQENIAKYLKIIEEYKIDLGEDNICLLIKYLLSHSYTLDTINLFNMEIVSKNNRLYIIDYYSTYLVEPILSNYYLSSYIFLTDEERDYFIKKLIEKERIDVLYKLLLSINELNQKDLIVEKVCQNLKLENIVKLSISRNMVNYLNFLYEQCLSYGIKGIYDFCYENLYFNDYKRIVNDMINIIHTDEDYDLVVEFVRNILLDETEINIIMKKLIETKISSAIELTNDSGVNYLSNDIINEIGEVLEKSYDEQIIYEYLFINKEKIPKKLKEKLEKKILKSNDIKYICLLTIYVDNALFKPLFKNISNLINVIDSLDDITYKEEVKCVALNLISCDEKSKSKKINKTKKRLNLYLQRQK